MSTIKITTNDGRELQIEGNLKAILLIKDCLTRKETGVVRFGEYELKAEEVAEVVLT